MGGHAYVCVECGTRETENRRFFGLKELLRCFVLTVNGTKISVWEYLRPYLHGVEIGALFGGKVMDAPIARLSRDEAEDLTQLTRIRLTVKGLLHMMEAQLQLEKNTLLPLLQALGDDDCAYYLQELEYDGKRDLAKEQLLWSYLAFEKRMTPLLNSALGNADTRRTECAAVIDALRDLLQAEQESEHQNALSEDELEIIADLSGQYVQAAWMYSYNKSSEVQVPTALVFVDPETREPRKCTRGCCPHCHRPIPRYFGSYQQVTVGVLGGQSTGKTTYLAAFSDFIDTDPSMNELPVTIGYEPELDPQWQRFVRAPKDGGLDSGSAEDVGAAGPRWMYQNGYRIRKTELSRTAAASLSFLVSSANKEDSQPVIYVLADVAGEAFTGKRDQAAAQVAENQNRLLANCDALFMVFSCDPEDTKIVAARYSEWMRGFSHSGVPAALLMTKADMLFSEENSSAKHRGLREAMELKVKTKPVVKNTYNVEAMSSLCELSKQCINELAPNLVGGLVEMLAQASGGDSSKVNLAVFPVCAGTAEYVELTGEVDAAARDRYTVAKSSRYGLMSPFYWLLALQGLLPAGRGHSELLQYPAETESELQKLLEYKLRHPIKP